MTPKEIRKTRLDHELTQQEAADLVSSSMRSWQEWESGRRNMPVAKWELFLIKVGE